MGLPSGLYEEHARSYASAAPRPPNAAQSYRHAAARAIAFVATLCYDARDSSEAPRVSDVDPAEFTKVTRATSLETFDSEFEEDDAPIATPKREREGLPSGYRMRADAHYVDQLSSSRRAQLEAPRAVVSDAPAGDRGDNAAADRERRLEKVLSQLAEDVATITAAASLLSGEASLLARRVNLDLIKSQSWRASWLLRANAILSGTHEAPIRPRPLAFILGQVRMGFASECRLNGVTLQMQSNDWNAVVAVDEPAVIAGIGGALVATLGLLSQSEGGVVTINAQAAGGELRAVEISQNDATVPPAMASRFFDAAWTERTGGWLAALGAATARSAAQLHGGDATVEPAEGIGGSIKLAFVKN